jgi:hypothetical protein
MGVKEIIDREFAPPNRESTMVRARSRRVSPRRPSDRGSGLPRSCLGPSEREPHLTIPRLPLPRQNLLRAAGLFVGAILFMRNFGEQMAI